MEKIKKIGIEKDSAIRRELRHFGVLFENMDHKWDLVAEQYGNIKKTLDEHTETLASHTEMIGEMKIILDSHTETLKSHTEMIGQIMVDLAINKEDIEFIKNSLKKKVDAEEFSALEKRVILLEKKLSAR